MRISSQGKNNTIPDEIKQDDRAPAPAESPGRKGKVRAGGWTLIFLLPSAGDEKIDDHAQAGHEEDRAGRDPQWIVRAKALLEC
jgi:hypothetical protein